MTQYIINFKEPLKNNDKNLLNKDLCMFINSNLYYFKEYKLTNKKLELYCDESIYKIINNLLTFCNFI